MVKDIEFRDAVRLYNVGFQIAPDRVEIRGHVVEVTFEVELSGSHVGHRADGNAQCPACMRVLNTLFEIADALRPLERAALGRPDQTCERYVRYSRASHEPYRVSLSVVVRTRRSFEQANDGWALEFWRDVARLLSDYGCRERHAATEAGTTPLQSPGGPCLGEWSRADSTLSSVA